MRKTRMTYQSYVDWYWLEQYRVKSKVTGSDTDDKDFIDQPKEAAEDT